MDFFCGCTREFIVRAEQGIVSKQHHANFCVRTFLKDSFGFAEHQEKSTFGLNF